jgi:hypothetical protein
MGPVFATTTPSQAGKPWHSVMADSDFTGECSTNMTAGATAAAPGGTSCYSTTQFVPNSANVLRITWSTAGDSHGGDAVQIGCVLTDQFGSRFCNPAGTGAAPGTYITKNKVPAGTGATNCNDGGGGDADCHDNSIEHTWCVDIVGDDVFTIDWRLASRDHDPFDAIPADFVFVEASNFYVDSTKVDGGCDANGQQD